MSDSNLLVEKVDEIMKNVGKPIKQVIRENIHWVPHYVKVPP